MNRDEVRRQLRDVDLEQKAVMGRWRDALMRVFVDGEDADHRVKAELVGAPGRRQFLKIGGVTVAGAAILAACGSDDDKKDSGSGKTTTTAASGDSTTTTEMGGGGKQDMDLTLLKTATSLELLAVAVYEKAIPLLKDATSQQVATLFKDQHSEHAKQLQGATKEGYGADAVYDMPNDYINKNVVEPALPTLKSDADIAKFALTLENTAASTYVTAGGLLSKPELRQAIMAIGGVEARHAAILSGVLEQSVPTVAFFSTKESAPKESFITS